MQTANERTAERLSALASVQEFALALRCDARATRLLALACLNESIRLLPVDRHRADEYARMGNNILRSLREVLREQL